MKQYEVVKVTDGADKWETLKVTDGDVVSWVPMVEGNRDYQDYLDSLEPAQPETE